MKERRISATLHSLLRNGFSVRPELPERQSNRLLKNQLRSRNLVA